MERYTINEAVIQLVIYDRECFFQCGNDIPEKNGDVCIDFIAVFLDIVKKILFYLVEFNPDDCIGLPLFFHTTESHLRVINLFTVHTGKYQIGILL